MILPVCPWYGSRNSQVVTADSHGGEGYTIRSQRNEDVYESAEASSALGFEEALLPIRWAILGIAIVVGLLYVGELTSSVLAFALVATPWNTLVTFVVRRKVHIRAAQIFVPVVDGLLTFGGLFVLGDIAAAYTPFVCMVLMTIGARLTRKQAVFVTGLLVILFAVLIQIVYERALTLGLWIFSTGCLTIVWVSGGVVRYVRSVEFSFEKLYRLLWDFPCGVIVEDVSGLYANDYIYQMLGLECPQRERLRSSFPQAVPERIQYVWHKMRETAGAGDGGPMQELTLRLDGDLSKVFLYQIMCLHSPVRRARLATVLDVTEQRSVEQRLQEQERLRLMGTLTTMAIHEIRNPLAAIRATAQLIKYDRNPESVSQQAGRIVRLVDELHTFLERLMDLGRLPVTARESYDPGDVMREVAALLAPLAHRSGVSIVLDPVEVRHNVVGDPNALRQVFINLVQNAIDAMEKGGTVTVGVREDEDAVVFSVADEGTGISDEVAARLFDPFYTTKERGTGLGLVISHQIVAEYGGEIWFERRDPGTVFYVKLPKQLLRQDSDETG